MTKRERAQVVELLRCGADVSSICDAGYATGRCDGINPCSKVYALAQGAYAAHENIIHGGGYHSYPLVCLEMAARVEEGTWP